MVNLDPSIVLNTMSDHDHLREFLLAEGQVSFAASLETSVPKVALLSAASWIEDRVQQIVLELYQEAIPNEPHRVSFVRSAGIERRYHTWFNWKTPNANSFFGLFGPEFKAFCAEQIKTSETLAGDIAAFMELGRLRNEMVHENFAAYALGKSVAEVETLFRRALAFVEMLPSLLRGLGRDGEGAEGT